jgi:hypothetical protein
MDEIDLQIIQNVGLMNTVVKLAERLYRDRLVLTENEAAAGHEETG